MSEIIGVEKLADAKAFIRRGGLRPSCERCCDKGDGTDDGALDSLRWTSKSHGSLR